MNKIKGFDLNRTVNIGDKHLTVVNTEDVSSYRIFIVDDVYELSPRENVYECTYYNFKIKLQITKNLN
jgi:hypothetical protein